MSAFEMELSSFELIFVSRCPDVNDLYSSEFHQRDIKFKKLLLRVLIRYLNNNKEHQRKQEVFTDNESFIMSTV